MYILRIMSPMRRSAVEVLILVVASTLLMWSQDQPEGARKAVIKTPVVYPTLAKSMNIHGAVKLEAVVEPNGTVKTVNVKGGHPVLTQAAVSAVLRWKFEPASHETRELIEIQFAQE